jgi:hypothetical protein
MRPEPHKVRLFTRSSAGLYCSDCDPGDAVRTRSRTGRSGDRPPAHLDTRFRFGDCRTVHSTPQSLKQAEKEVALALQQLLNDTQTNSNVESLDQTEQLAQELQQLLNEAQTKQRAKAPRPDRATCWGIEHPARPSKPASRTTPRSACLGGRTVTK